MLGITRWGIFYQKKKKKLDGEFVKEKEIVRKKKLDGEAC